MEKRLDWEVEGVRLGLVLNTTGDDWGLVGAEYFEDRGDGVVPYGWALEKLYAGSMKNALLAGLEGHAAGPRGDVGEDAAEPALDADSYSAKRQVSEQYTLPSVCLSQARQNDGDQSISIVIVYVCCGVVREGAWELDI
jgi:hypothetical protein